MLETKETQVATVDHLANIDNNYVAYKILQ